MATKKPTTKKAETPLFDWGDGKAVHKISKEQHAENVRAKATPIAPPPGSYDPNLDATERGAKRGLSDLIDDTALGKRRLTADYDIGIGDIRTTHGRNLSDLLTARTRTGEDYGSNIATLQRNFQNLGTAQAGAQRKAGVSLGGAAEQAAAKRAANEAIQRAPIDTAYKRFTDDSALGEKRLIADTGEGGTAEKRLSIPYLRNWDDLGTQQTRGEREGTEFGLDTAAARQFQASQLGIPVITQTPKKIPDVPVTGAVNTTLTTGPGLAGVKKKRKGRTVTYTASTTGP